MHCRKKYCFGAMLLVSAVLWGASLAMAYKDGTYEGEYYNETWDSTTKVILTLKEGKIVSCDLIATDADGYLKDENYAIDSGAENYRLAQRAVEGMKEYPAMLVETQDVEEMDAVSGATVTFKEFEIAVREALKKAK